MNVNKININQSEPTYYIASDIYDVSYHNNGATFTSLSALLSNKNLSTLIPLAARCGGMTIRFIQSSVNKYVQYRYILSDVSIESQFANPINWKGYANVEDFVEKDSSTTSISDETNALYITDGNGKAIAKYDDDGLHINKMNSNRSKYIVCDETGNIAFRIRKNGESDIILSQESFLAALNKTSNYKDDSFKVDIPEELFRVTNDIYSKREYAPRLFAERLQETENELTFENGSTEWYVARKTLDMFSNLSKTDSVSRQVFVDMYRRKNISFNLHTTKASVFYGKTLNFLPIGDSITAQNNWHTYIRKLLLMDNVDWQIANSSVANKYGMQTIGINRSTSNTAFTYRNKNVNVHYNYHEGRSSWAAATYLRHADLYTWAAVSYNGISKSILHVAWRVLGLYEKYNVEYSGTAQQRNYIRTTCNGQYSITSACIDGYVWNNYRSKIGYGSVDYSNATSAQKN